MKTRNRIWHCTFVALCLTVIHLNSCKKDNESQIPDNKVVVTDADGNQYKSVIIGSQVWMAENLKTTRYNDSTSIQRLYEDRYCGDSPSYVTIDEKDIYGAIYSWQAVATGKLCPTGWHIPSDDEWIELINYLGGFSLAGGKLKETGTIHWQIPNNDAYNSNGFTALPAGYHTGWFLVSWFVGFKHMWREDSGYFLGFGNTGSWWSSTQFDEFNAIGFTITNETSNVYKTNYIKKRSNSVRCIKDMKSLVSD